MWRAAHEKFLWDRIGFVLLACAAGFMIWRRVTARLEYYQYADNIILPTIITILSTSAAVCFVIEMSVRILKDKERVLPVHGTYLWPFLLFILLSATNDVDISVLQSVNLLNQEDLRREALLGEKRALACEQLRWDCAVNIDTLRIIQSFGGKDGEIAKQKLEALKKRLGVVDDRRH